MTDDEAVIELKKQVKIEVYDNVLFSIEEVAWFLKIFVRLRDLYSLQK